jgi:hypothetical protein
VITEMSLDGMLIIVVEKLLLGVARVKMKENIVLE